MLRGIDWGRTNSNRLKKYALILLPFLLYHASYAQTADSSLSTDKNIRNKVLSDIQDNLDRKTKNIDQTLTKLDHKVDSLHIEIAASRDPREKPDKLLHPLQALNTKQAPIDQNALYAYHATSQSP